MFYYFERRYKKLIFYSFETANSTAQNDVIVTVDGNATTGGTDWVFDAGSRTTALSTGIPGYFADDQASTPSYQSYSNKSDPYKHQ